VDQGKDVPVCIEIDGRIPREIAVQAQANSSHGDGWNVLPARRTGGRNAQGRNVLRFEAVLKNVRDPLRYRVVAGSARSPTYEIAVRYPLAVQKFEVTLTPPSYTGVQASTLSGGNFTAIAGSNAQLRIMLDAPCTTAYLNTELAGHRGTDRQPRNRRIPLDIDQSTLTGQMHLESDLFYLIEALSPDGRCLPLKRYRVVVRQDQAPQVHFEQPDEMLEVHSLAELAMRVRVDDDFGLARAGIVFQVNDGQEQTLVLKQFGQAPEKDMQGESVAVQSQRIRQAILEKVLALEEHSLSPTESVTYYAFAEDNLPCGAHRTQTDLRFIDIRPFKRVYVVGGS
jgi:hypothetical protein